MGYPPELIARVKGAIRAGGMKPKQIAYLTGIPIETIREWAKGERRASIEPDQSVGQELSQAILGRFMGRFCTR